MQHWHKIRKKKQVIRFSGSAASNQNGESEQAIKTVVTMARTILIHSDIRYTEETLTNDICPMETDYSIRIYNWIPDMKSGLSTIEIQSS